uniref:Uncharacterized protein n=1 Tax=Timema tahoe TaxID=61484 RepID=A0A7R9FIX5_9NEOP|nr:unnamed protein product [Timema tahoe]
MSLLLESFEEHALTAQAASTTFCPEPSPIPLYTQILEISGHIVTPFCSGSPQRFLMFTYAVYDSSQTNLLF